ncbi:unnamed protein product [Rotaria sp. Silwood2]|nr:unnamed protein product [Rotaria sp. Silwood2]CAF3046847.1 unnamed protein product [Rotaria sp. Silwood2]CAF4171748.1 unnamed protein product [Rotaria sp. Silwood2]CAF4248446.1 unnamed protein product [Rotaria sp. Silwood2]
MPSLPSVNHKFTSKIVNGKPAIIQRFFPVTSHELHVGATKVLEVPRIMPDGRKDTAILEIEIEPNTLEGYTYHFQGAGEYLENNKFQDVHVVLACSDVKPHQQQQSCTAPIHNQSPTTVQTNSKPYTNYKFTSKMVNGKPATVQRFLPATSHELHIGATKVLKIPRIMPDGRKDIAILEIEIEPDTLEGYTHHFQGAGEHLENDKFQDVHVVITRSDVAPSND